MMNAKISDQLKQMIASAEEAETEKGIPVIVTVVEGADSSQLERKGFTVQHFVESIGAASMTLSVKQIRELAKMEQVELIEFDGAGVWPL